MATANHKRKRRVLPRGRRGDTANAQAAKLGVSVLAGGIVGGFGSALLAYAGANPYGVGVGMTATGMAGTFAFKKSGQKTAQYFCAGLAGGGGTFTAMTYSAKKLVRKADDGGAYLETRNVAELPPHVERRPLEPRLSCDLTFPDRMPRAADLPPDIERAMAEARAELEAEDDEDYDDIEEDVE